MHEESLLSSLELTNISFVAISCITIAFLVAAIGKDRHRISCEEKRLFATTVYSNFSLVILDGICDSFRRLFGVLDHRSCAVVAFNNFLSNDDFPHGR